MRKQLNQTDSNRKKREPKGKQGQGKRRKTGGTSCWRQGEWTELRFMSEAARRGLTVLRPWTRGSVYDVLVDHAHRFPRVQVKSAGRPRRIKWVQPHRGAVYTFRTRRDNGIYHSNEFDFYALYIIPRDLWYIVPYRAVGPVQLLYVFPDDQEHRFERYREAWQLLRQDPDSFPLAVDEDQKAREDEDGRGGRCKLTSGLNGNIHPT